MRRAKAAGRHVREMLKVSAAYFGFRRRLTRAERRSLRRDPWQIFQRANAPSRAA